MNDFVFNDPPRIEWIRVNKAVKLLWADNPKIHNIEEVCESIARYGFQELPKFDENLPNVAGTLGAFKAGNGRIEAVALLEQQKKPIPRGLGIDESTNEWVMPVLFGTDAVSLQAAQSYAIDSNNLTLVGLSSDDLKRMWSDKYLSLLEHLREDDTLPVSVKGYQITALLQDYEPANNAYEEWQQMPSYNQGDAFAPVKTLMVHFASLEDVQKFAAALGQTVTEASKYIWYPAQPSLDIKNYKAVGDAT